MFYIFGLSIYLFINFNSFYPLTPKWDGKFIMMALPSVWQCFFVRLWLDFPIFPHFSIHLLAPCRGTGALLRRVGELNLISVGLVSHCQWRRNGTQDLKIIQPKGAVTWLPQPSACSCNGGDPALPICSVNLRGDGLGGSRRRWSLIHQSWKCQKGLQMHWYLVLHRLWRGGSQERKIACWTWGAGFGWRWRRGCSTGW